MDTFLRLATNRQEKIRKYCHVRPALGNGNGLNEGDTYFFQIQVTLEENHKLANKILYKDGVEKIPATIESNKELVTHSTHVCEDSQTHCGGGRSIFHANYWVDETGNHPIPGTMISFSDVNNFVWKPVDRHQIDYCRYATRELENNNMRLQITHDKRKVLLILHPQNDFCDRVPGLYPADEIVIDDFEGFEVLQSCPTKYNGRAAFQAADPRSPDGGRRRGIVKGFRSKRINRDSAMAKYYVEVLWDADIYRPADLRVEGLEESRSPIRDFRRLQNACKTYLRVYLSTDTRADASKRYGRLLKVEITGVQVRWDLSVPSYVAMKHLHVEDDGRGAEFSFPPDPPNDDIAVDINDRIRKGSRVVSLEANAVLTPMPSSSSDATASAAPPIRSLSAGNTVSRSVTSLHMYGRGTVVNVSGDGDHAEVFWDAENTCGNLPVMGSYTDLTLVAKLIKENWETYDEIIISRDCHRCNHISHKSYWVSPEGVNDYTTIKYTDVLTGKVVPAQKEFGVSVRVEQVYCSCGGYCLEYWDFL
jgi:hypothetical protein